MQQRMFPLKAAQNKTAITMSVFIFIILKINVALSGTGCVTTYDIEPLAEDIYMLELINRARANPGAETRRYNIDLNEGVHSTTLTNEPKQPLAFNLKLYKAALSHSRDMLAENIWGHISSNGNTPADRAIAQGYNNYSGENLAINMSTGPLKIDQDVAAYHHELLFIDKDYPGRTHRVNMLAASHVEAGIAMAYGNFIDQQNQYWPNAVNNTMNFGRGEWPPYICGVIYDDKNNNAFYDVGEGIPHATLTIVETGERVEAYSAGAYSLNISKQGALTVKAYLCDYNTYATKIVEIGSENIKLDFLLSDFTEKGTISGDTDDCEELSVARILRLQSTQEIADAPVQLSTPPFTYPVADSNSSSLDISVSFPCYTVPVDIYVALLTPDQILYFLNNDGMATTEFEYMFLNSTKAQQTSFRLKDILNGVPKGLYGLYWLVVPSSGGNYSMIDFNGCFQLGYYSFKAN